MYVFKKVRAQLWFWIHTFTIWWYSQSDITKEESTNMFINFGIVYLHSKLDLRQSKYIFYIRSYFKILSSWLPIPARRICLKFLGSLTTLIRNGPIAQPEKYYFFKICLLFCTYKIPFSQAQHTQQPWPKISVISDFTKVNQLISFGYSCSKNKFLIFMFILNTFFFLHVPSSISLAPIKQLKHHYLSI